MNDRWMKRKDGSHFWAWALHRPRWPPRPSIGYCSRYATSRRIKKQKTLAQADWRKNEFRDACPRAAESLGTDPHVLHILRQSADEDPTLADVNSMMERQVNHLVRLVDLLEVSRITVARSSSAKKK
jgi:hypothetical protein